MPAGKIASETRYLTHVATTEQSLAMIVLTPEEKHLYLRNLVIVARSDGRVEDPESAALRRACDGIDGSDEELQRALSTFGEPDVDVDGFERFSTQARNLEDMIEIAICDGEMTEREREILLHTALEIGVNQDLVNKMLSQAQARLSIIG